MESNVNQIANNYMTQHNTRKSRSKSRWVWGVGSVLAVIGLLYFYGATKAKALSFEGTAAEEIISLGQVVSEYWGRSENDKVYHYTRVKYQQRYYGCMSYMKYNTPKNGEHYMQLLCALTR